MNRIPNLNFCTAKAGLTGLSGANNTFTTGLFTYAINGKAYKKSAVTGGNTPATSADGKALSVSPGEAAVVVWAVDADGNVLLFKGETVSAGAAPEKAPQFPDVPNDATAFAYTTHKVDAGGAAFTLGVSNWNTAGATHTVQDVLALPTRPQVA